LFLGNIDPELQLRVLDQVERPKLVCADTMNYWISSKRATLLELLPRIDVLMVNDAEARQLAGESNVMKAAAAIEKMGARAVCIKRGEYGALLVSGKEAFFAPAYPLSNVVDPTGAGDSFAGGFLGLLDRTGVSAPSANGSLKNRPARVKSRAIGSNRRGRLAARPGCCTSGCRGRSGAHGSTILAGHRLGPVRVRECTTKSEFRHVRSGGPSRAPAG